MIKGNELMFQHSICRQGGLGRLIARWTSRKKGGEPRNAKRTAYIFFSKRFGLSYFPVAKSASSGLRPWMYSLDNQPYCQENALNGDRTVILPVKEYRVQFASYYLFTCVRNPFSRLISSYLDKFVYSVFSDGERIQRKGSSIRAFKGSIDKFTAIEQYAQDEAGSTPESGLTFEAFLKTISPEWPPELAERGSRCDPHWASQFDLISLTQLSYDAILKCESLFSEMDELQSQLGIPTEKHFRSRSNETRGNVSRGASGVGYIGDTPAAELSRTGIAKQAINESFYRSETLELVSKMYNKDLAVFGYEAPQVTK